MIIIATDVNGIRNICPHPRILTRIWPHLNAIGPFHGHSWNAVHWSWRGAIAITCFLRGLIQYFDWNERHHDRLDSIRGLEAPASTLGGCDTPVFKIELSLGRCDRTSRLLLWHDGLSTSKSAALCQQLRLNLRLRAVRHRCPVGTVQCKLFCPCKHMVIPSVRRHLPIPCRNSWHKIQSQQDFFGGFS